MFVLGELQVSGWFDMPFTCPACGMSTPSRVWGTAAMTERPSLAGSTEARALRRAWEDACSTLSLVRCPRCHARDRRALATRSVRLDGSRTRLVGLFAASLPIPALLLCVTDTVVAVVCAVALIAFVVCVRRLQTKHVPSLEEIDRRVVFHAHA